MSKEGLGIEVDYEQELQCGNGRRFCDCVVVAGGSLKPYAVIVASWWCKPYENNKIKQRVEIHYNWANVYCEGEKRAWNM